MSILSDIFGSLGIGTQGVPGSSTSGSSSSNNLWSILIPTVGTTIGSIIAANAGNNAANTQANAATQSTQQAIDFLRQQDALNRADTLPWRAGGSAALGVLLNKMGIDTRGWFSGPGSFMGTGAQGTSGASATPQFTQQGFSTLPMRGSAIDDQGNFLDDSAPLPQWYLNRQNLDLVPGAADDNAQSGFMSSASGAGSPQGALPADFGSLTHRFSPTDFANNMDPGLEFRLAEGQKALDHSAAAKGGAMGGRAIKAALRYGQDYGSNEYSKAYDRFNLDNTNEFNRYATLAGLVRRPHSRQRPIAPIPLRTSRKTRSTEPTARQMQGRVDT
jgi:hypothetical protein